MVDWDDEWWAEVDEFTILLRRDGVVEWQKDEYSGWADFLFAQALIEDRFGGGNVRRPISARRRVPYWDPPYRRYVFSDLKRR